MPAAAPRTPPARALALLERAARESPYFLVAASGGKDSNVLFPLLEDLKKKDPRIRVGAFHMYMARGIECVERPIKVLCQRLGAPLFYVPHFALPDHLFLGEARERTSDAARRALGLKATECEDAARIYFAAHLSGLPEGAVDQAVARSQAPPEGEGESAPRLKIEGLTVDPWRDVWVLRGERARDSLQRRAMISSFRLQRDAMGFATGGCVGLSPKERRVFPVHDWTANEVLAFARARRCPPAAPIGKTNGSNLEPADALAVAALRRLYPSDYARFVRLFPNARDSGGGEG